MKLSQLFQISENITHDPNVIMHLDDIIAKGHYTNDGQPLVIGRLLSIIDHGGPKWWQGIHESGISTSAGCVELAKKLSGSDLVEVARELKMILTSNEPPKIDYPCGAAKWLWYVTSRESTD